MKRQRIFYATVTIFFALGIIASIITGKFPLRIADLIVGDSLALGVFYNLRLARTAMATLAGFGLSVAGYVYQTIFKNPIAAPDIIGVSSGACAGAGFGIIFFGGGTFVVAISAFFGGIIAVVMAIMLASAAGDRRLASFVLSGIAINSIAQAVLMLLKRMADPFSELAALEFWTMGSLASIKSEKVLVVLPIIFLSTLLLFALYRQITLLSLKSDEAKMLGVSVGKIRALVLIITTLIVSAIVSVTGLITFVGLIAPHITRLMTKTHSAKTMFFAGLLGATILLFADCAARIMASTEIPISILTSLIGAPILISLVIRGGHVE